MQFIVSFTSLAFSNPFPSAYRQEQESLLRTEADDRCHTLVKKLEFNEQVHAQQMAELKERLEQSQATVISLESRINASTKNDLAIPDVLKQVREHAESELKRYQFESQEHYNRNVSSLGLRFRICFKGIIKAFVPWFCMFIHSVSSFKVQPCSQVAMSIYSALHFLVVAVFSVVWLNNLVCVSHICL